MPPVSNQQPVRLRDLRDTAVPRDKSEVRAPTRRPKFEDSLKHEKAGEVVGEFPPKFDKGLSKQTLKRSALQVATERQQPRQAVAALMAREGISTSTKWGSTLKKAPVFGAGASGDKSDKDKTDDAKVEEKKPAWMMLAGDSPEDKANLAFADRIKRLRDQQKELKDLDKFSKTVDGFSTLDQHMRANDKRVLQEAGRIERSSEKQLLGSGNKESMNLELMKKEMAMNQALNMQYLALQDKLQRGLTSLLSNLLKTRSEATKNAISQA
ncbi:MAG: hypothetical protein IT381_11120 [Deltaproteobacteria bacterium]|nr:hypothetical protein [Deltaproteobacteria bacterium]